MENGNNHVVLGLRACSRLWVLGFCGQGLGIGVLGGMAFEFVALRVMFQPRTQILHALRPEPYPSTVNPKSCTLQPELTPQSPAP